MASEATDYWLGSVTPGVLTMKRIADIVRGTSPMSAGQLAEALKAAEREQAQLEGEARSLSDRRVAALLGEPDDVLDKIETELNAVHRKLDRAEMRVPHLRRLLLDQKAKEAEATSASAFDTAVDRRVDAARKLESALQTLGEAFKEFYDAGSELRALKPEHSFDDHACCLQLIGAVRRNAPEFAEQFGIGRNAAFTFPLGPLALSESEFWQRARDDEQPRWAA